MRTNCLAARATSDAASAIGIGMPQSLSAPQSLAMTTKAPSRAPPR